MYQDYKLTHRVYVIKHLMHSDDFIIQFIIAVRIW